MKYRIADLVIDIKNRFPYTDRFCRNYLCDQDAACAFAVTASETDIAAEKAASAQPYSDGYLENICLYRNLCVRLPEFDRFLLHAAILEYRGFAYAFLGRSGTGKSTHTGLWLQYAEGAKILNGDKPILHYTGDGFTAYGTPWNGKENKGYNGFAPLKALCFLEQSKTNKLSRLSPSEAAVRLFSQVLIPEEEENADKTLFFMDKLVTVLPCWLLECDISQTAVLTALEITKN